jgi:anti-sigma factor RsiW
MKCTMNKRKLSAYLDGEMSEKEKKAMGEHLEHCEECRKELAAISSVVDALNGVEGMDVPPYFMTRLRQEIREQARPEPFFQRIRRMALSAGAIVAVAVSLFAGSQMGRTIYQSITQDSELNSSLKSDVFGMGTFEEFPGGSLSDIYNELVTGGNNG